MFVLPLTDNNVEEATQMNRPITFLSLIFLASSAYALDVVVPNSLTNTAGPQSNSIPFSANVFCINGWRYQQVYDDGEIPDGNFISAIRFRQGTAEGFDNNFPLTAYTVSISMSTTTANSTNVSDTFADNHGPDEVIVFAGNLEISSPVTTLSPAPFDIEIPITPFAYYDGNLLVDFTFQGCVQPAGVGLTFFDYAWDWQGGTTPMARITNIQDDVSAATGISDPGGLVTQFALSPIDPSPIPTMSEWSLMLLTTMLSLTAFVYYRRRKVGAVGIEDI